jgi:hypothetical protein
MTAEDKIKTVEQATQHPVYVGTIAGGDNTIYACVDDHKIGGRVMCPGETRETAVDALYARYAE